MGFMGKKVCMFIGGMIFGTAGFKILGSRDAKSVYAKCTAAAIRAKDCVVDKATVIQENAADIYAEAKKINEERAEAEAKNVVEDISNDEE